MKNDIALLQVNIVYSIQNVLIKWVWRQVEPSHQFALAYNEQWVQLSDDYTRYRDCSYSINTSNVCMNWWLIFSTLFKWTKFFKQVTNIYPFSQPKRTTVVNNESCFRNNSYLEIRNADLCSFYDFDHSFMCQLPETQLKFSRDRGTPLICDNAKLVGILSVIIPANMTSSINVCTRTLRTNAFYTKISTYEKWIHSIIAVNSPTYSANGKPVPLVPLSPPFQSIA